MEEYEGLEEAVEELAELEELPRDVVEELEDDSRRKVRIDVDYPVWKALMELKKRWGTSSHSKTIARLIRLAAARKNELKVICNEEDDLKKLLFQYGPKIFDLLESLTKKEVKA